MGVKNIIRTPQSTLATRSELIMPDSVNMLHNLMGGNILRWMDITAAVAAQKFSGADCVTAAVSNVSFENAIKNGDILTLEAKVVRDFNTSMEVHIRGFTGKSPNITSIITNEAFFIFVAVDKNQIPIQVPTIKPETEEEKKMYHDALIRREIRNLFSHENKKNDSQELIKLLSE